MYQTLALFPTSVLRVSLPAGDWQQQVLAEEVLLLRNRLPSVSKTNVGGWHSPPVLQQLPEPALRQLITQLPQYLNLWAQQFFQCGTAPDPALWQLQVWANCNEQGHSNKAHDHFTSGIVASGFFYVRCGGPQAGGETVFINQQSCPLSIRSHVPLAVPEHRVTPQDGDLYIFPSWLGHKVNVYRGQQTRISIAFNASHPALQVVKKTDKPARLPLLRDLKAWYWRR